MISLPDDANPKNHAGERNLRCRYYVLCLDIAAANLWPEFTCDFCFHRKDKSDPKIDEMDLCAPGWEDIWGGTG